MKMLRRHLLLATTLLPLPALAAAAAECIAPAKPGGGFDLTCQLVRDLLALPLPDPAAQVQVKYLPGGIGALAFHRAVTQQWSDARQFIAFSSGSLLNLAQGKFGPHGPDDVKWLATLGVDYGVVAVRKDSPLRNLAMLRDTLRQNPAGAVFGAGGALGSQDWMKAALLVKASGSDHRAMRFVSFEGGGQAISALKGGHVDVFCGDAAEARDAAAAGGIRLIAVLADKRLPGALAQVPTAVEQGVDLLWPTVRGIYMGPGVSDRQVEEWARVFRKAAASSGFASLVQAHGLQPRMMAGAEVRSFVQEEVARMRGLAVSLGLPVR